MKKAVDYSKTLVVRSDTAGLQYDINGIVKAFFPEYEVRVLEPDEKVHDEDIFNVKPFMILQLQKEDEKLVDIMYAPGSSVAADSSTVDEVMYTPGFSVAADSNTVDEVMYVPGSSVAAEYNTCEEHYPLHYILNNDNESGIKDTFKRFLYDTLSEITGRKLPWGNLTGVRPTKIAMTMMREGMTDGEIGRYMEDHHRVSREKIDLSIDIAHREAKLLDKLDYQKGYSLYIGIPFCPTTCLYCSFTSFPISVWKKRVDDYLDALGKELDYVAGEYQGKSLHPDTVYIGGGTPTSLDEEHLEKLLKRITETIDMTGCLEFTCEAGRPDSITEEKLEIMKKYGVTRISVNPQTMQQKTLDLIGRRVRVEQVIDAFYAARKLGFENINMDIILGLPGEEREDVADTLEKITEMKPDSLTVHSLAIKRASALRQRLDEIGIDALKNTDETMGMSSEAAAGMGMKPYYLYRQKNMSGNFENTGFASPGKEGIYNILIMEEVQTIVACGAGTVTKRVDYKDGQVSSISRCENVKDVSLYIDQIDDMIERKRQLFS